MKALRLAVSQKDCWRKIAIALIYRFESIAFDRTDHGVALLARLKARYPDVPFVFYSRKITPENVIHVLRAGAADAIRKGALGDEEVLARLAAAQELHGRRDARTIRALGLNVNVTIVPGEK